MGRKTTQTSLGSQAYLTRQMPHHKKKTAPLSYPSRYLRPLTALVAAGRGCGRSLRGRGQNCSQRERRARGPALPQINMEAHREAHKEDSSLLRGPSSSSMLFWRSVILRFHGLTQLSVAPNPVEQGLHLLGHAQGLAVPAQPPHRGEHASCFTEIRQTP